MSVNKYLPHVLVLPEDEADANLATGFSLHESVDLRAIQILPEAGGWRKVRSLFEDVHIAEMQKNPLRHMVLLIDFDGKDGRLDDMTSVIPECLKQRVFVIGAWTTPEDLRGQLGDLEKIGKQLAAECHQNKRDIWGHPLLRHNEEVLGRMQETIRPILFPSNSTRVQ
jgi:hypothetical protein